MVDPTADYIQPPRTAGEQTFHMAEILHSACQACRAAVARLSITTIDLDQYDFFAFGVAAGLVFGGQFFPSLSPVSAALASLGTFLVGFFALQIVTGLIIRVRLRSSPAYDLARVARLLVRIPLGELVRRCPIELVAGTLAVTAAPAVGLLLYVYLIPYGQQVLHVPVTAAMLVLSAISGVGILVAIRVSAW